MHVASNYYHYELTHGFLFYSMSYIPLLLLATVLLKLSQIWPVWIFSSWFLGPFDMSSSFFFFFEYFLTSWHEQIFQGSSSFPPLALESAISPRSTVSFQWGRIFRSQNLGAMCAHCYWVPLLQGPCSKWNQENFHTLNSFHKFGSRNSYYKIIPFILGLLGWELVQGFWCSVYVTTHYQYNYIGL